MTKKKRFGISPALSQGFSDTINIVENAEQDYRNAVIPLNRIERDPENPRKLILTDEELLNSPDKSHPDYSQKNKEYQGLVQLAESIEQGGLIHPILVYKQGEMYRIVAGERRTLAFKKLGKSEIEARVFNTKPKGYQRKLVQWFENNARVDLNLYQRINNIRELLKSYQSEHDKNPITPSLIKKITGLSMAQSSNYLQLLNSPEDLLLAIQQERIINIEKAVAISKLDTINAREEAIKEAIAGRSLQSLKNLNKKKPAPKSTPNKKRGPAASRINLGHTKNKSAIKTVIHTVLEQPEYQSYQNKFTKINWDSYEDITQAFKTLLGLLEKQQEGA